MPINGAQGRGFAVEVFGNDGFGYILNRFGGYMLNDPREVALRQAVMKAVA